MIDCEKFCYVHIPKTGGTSIREALKHFDPDTVSRDAHAIPSSVSDKLVFTFIRHPLHLLKSWYVYRRLNGPSEGGFLLDEIHHNTSSFNQFVEESTCQQAVTKLYAVAAHVVNTYGRFERLNEDLNAILAMVGIAPVTLERLNVASSNEKWDVLLDEISPALKDRVIEREHWVYETWRKTRGGVWCVNEQ